jgi:hypothetical protein
MPNYSLKGTARSALGFFARNRNVVDPTVATPGGLKASAAIFTDGICLINTVASVGDSVLVPAAKLGDTYIIINRGANAARLYGAGTTTIDGVATGTGVTIAAGKAIRLIAIADGQYLSYTYGAATS